MTTINLRPLQMTAQHRQAALQEINLALENNGLEELITERVSDFYNADVAESDPIRRRMLRNFSLAYTKTELERSVRAQFEKLLGMSVD